MSPKYAGCDSRSGYVFCSSCNDFIYDAELDKVHLAAVVTAEERQNTFQKVPRENYKSWTPTEKEVNALEGSEAVSCQGQSVVDPITKTTLNPG